MKRSSWIKKATCIVLVISSVLSMSLSVVAAKTFEEYEVKAIVAGKEDAIQLSLLNVNGSAYIPVEMAAELSGMEFSVKDSGDYVFTKGRHQTIYDGQIQEVDGGFVKTKMQKKGSKKCIV